MQSRLRSYSALRTCGPSRRYTSPSGPQLCSQPEAALLEGRPSKGALESGQACYASELVAQGVRILVFAAHEVEARAAGGGEVDEDVCEWPHAGLLATEWALFACGFAYGELVVVAPTDLGIQLPEGGEVVDAVLLLKSSYRLVESANTALPDLVQELLLTLVLRPLPYGLEPVQKLALGCPDFQVFLGDYPVV